MAELDTTKLQPDADTPIPRIRLSEVGFTGLKVAQDKIYEESNEALRWPCSIKTFKDMSEDTIIYAGLSLFKMMMSKVDWYVKADEGASEQTVERAAFIQSCMVDMEHSWFFFVTQLLSAYNYGFSVHEKVFRRRLKINGSRYNDGLVGIRKLPIRSQSTISGWNFDADFRNLESIKQNRSLLASGVRGAFSKVTSEPEIIIPREKFLLFRTNVEHENPEGTSPLIPCYQSWKFRKELEKAEAIRTDRGTGIPLCELPPKYMAPDALPEDKAVYDAAKQIVRNLRNGEQAGIVWPLLYDPDSRQPLFKFSLLSLEGTGDDSDKIITRYDNKILQALFADLLKLGSTNVGSYSLADAKTSLVAMAIEYRLKEIQDVLNTDLIPALYKLNGWDMAELPKFCFGDLESQDLEVFSKAIQRCAATATIARTPGNINHIAEVLGLPDRVDEDISQEKLNIMLGNDTSRAGDGMSQGSGNGTSSTVSSDDNSANNLENSS